MTNAELLLLLAELTARINTLRDEVAQVRRELQVQCLQYPPRAAISYSEHIGLNTWDDGA